MTEGQTRRIRIVVKLCTGHKLMGITMQNLMSDFWSVGQPTIIQGECMWAKNSQLEAEIVHLAEGFYARLYLSSNFQEPMRVHEKLRIETTQKRNMW